MYAVIAIITMYIYSALAYFAFNDASDRFSTVFVSFITMFQLLIGEGWHEVIPPCISPTPPLYLPYTSLLIGEGRHSAVFHLAIVTVWDC